MIAIKLKTENLQRQIEKEIGDIQFRVLKVLQLLATDKDFLKNVSEFVIEYINENQGNYLKLSPKYQRVKGNSRIFFGTKTETMIKSIRDGSAFQVAYDSRLKSILIELINRTALYNQESRTHKRIVLETSGKLKNRVVRLLQRLLVSEFGAL